MATFSLRVLVPRDAPKTLIEVLVREKQRLDPDSSVHILEKDSGKLLDVRAPLNRYFQAKR